MGVNEPLALVLGGPGRRLLLSPGHQRAAPPCRGGMPSSLLGLQREGEALQGYELFRTSSRHLYMPHTSFCTCTKQHSVT